MLVKRDICFHWKFNPEDSNYENAQLSKMTEGGSEVYAKEKAFVPEDAVNVPRNKEDATKCCNARTRLPQRRRVIERILAEELENLTGPLKW